VKKAYDGTLVIEGRCIAFSRWGDGSEVLLLHGHPTNRSLWHLVGPLLFNAGVNVLAIDLLGYGGSDKPADTDLGIAAQAEIVSKAAARLGWEKGVVAGHDAGGGIAMLLALENPTSATALVLVDTVAFETLPPSVLVDPGNTDWDHILTEQDFSLEPHFQRMLANGLVDKELVDPDLLARYLTPFEGRDGRSAYLRAARAFRVADLSLRMPEIAALSVPTLIIWGAEDKLTPAAVGVRLSEHMASATLEIVPDVGHFLPEEAPADVARRILRMIRSSQI
jgi:pimeloyl-ACP methyl ester carboxylesterase